MELFTLPTCGYTSGARTKEILHRRARLPKNGACRTTEGWRKWTYTCCMSGICNGKHTGKPDWTFSPPMSESLTKAARPSCAPRARLVKSCGCCCCPKVDEVVNCGRRNFPRPPLGWEYGEYRFCTFSILSPGSNAVLIPESFPVSSTNSLIVLGVKSDGVILVVFNCQPTAFQRVSDLYFPQCFTFSLTGNLCPIAGRLYFNCLAFYRFGRILKKL